MQARDLMTESPICVTPQDTIRIAAQRMRDMDCGILPVVDSLENNRLVGLLTDRDIVVRGLAAEMDCNNAAVEQVMTTPNLVCVNPDTSADDVVDKMEEFQVRRIPVVDTQNTVVGMVSTADIALELDDEEEIAEVFEEISKPTYMPRG